MDDQDRIIKLAMAIVDEAERKGLPNIVSLARTIIALMQPPPALGVSVSDTAVASDRVGR